MNVRRVAEANFRQAALALDEHELTLLSCLSPLSTPCIAGAVYGVPREDHDGQYRTVAIMGGSESSIAHDRDTLDKFTKGPLHSVNVRNRKHGRHQTRMRKKLQHTQSLDRSRGSRGYSPNFDLCDPPKKLP